MACNEGSLHVYEESPATTNTKSRQRKEEARLLVPEVSADDDGVVSLVCEPRTDKT